MKVKPRYQEELSDSGMSLKYTRLAWHRYLADGTDVKSSFTLEAWDAVSKPARQFARAAMADV